MRKELKSKRIYPSKFYGHHNIAFKKFLEECDSTRRIYDIDPYAAVHRFRENLYGIYQESMNNSGDVWSYLIIGPEKAMLIDTGYGIGNLRGLCEQLTDNMPLIVVNTHAHRDHVLGNFQFDRVYMHEYSVPQLRGMMYPQVRDHLLNEKGEGKWLIFDKEDLVPYREYEMIGCPDGYIFDLGNGYEIELIHVPGHLPGEIFLLDKTARILFSGDGVSSYLIGVGHTHHPGVAPIPYEEHMTIESFKNALERTIERMGEFDSVFPSHFMVDFDPSILVDTCNTCKEILANPQNYDDVMEINGFYGKDILYLKNIGTFGTIGYAEGFVYNPAK